MKLTQILPIFLILAFFGAGCGATNDEQRTTNNEYQAANSELDPCGLVDKAEVDALYDVPSEIIQHDVEPINPTGQKLCVYDFPSEDAVTMVTIGVQAQGDMRDGLFAEDLFTGLKDVVDSFEEINDLGDAAFQSQMDFVGGGALYALAKNKTVLLTIDVSLGKLDHAANQQAERELARKILEGLGD